MPSPKAENRTTIQTPGRPARRSRVITVSVGAAALSLGTYLVFWPSDEAVRPTPQAAQGDTRRIEPPARGEPVQSAPLAAVEPPVASVGVAADSDLPPLPYVPFVPPRPRQVVEAVYEFAARHPEVLRYVPCYCGCEANGHRANEDCFVAARDSAGRVTWDDHGLG